MDASYESHWDIKVWKKKKKKKKPSLFFSTKKIY